MAKKAQVTIQDINEILDEGVLRIITKYRKMQRVFNYLVDTSDKPNSEIAEEAGIAESKLYRRKNKPDLWQDEEIMKLYKPLDIQRLEQELKKNKLKGKA